MLDMHANSLRSGTASPGEVLVMDETGNLVVHSEFDDRVEYDRYVSGPEDSDGPGPPPGAAGGVGPIDLEQ